MNIPPYQLLLLGFSIVVTSCIPVSFNMRDWEQTSAQTERIDDIEFSVDCRSNGKGLLRQRSSGPWKVNLLSISPKPSRIEVLNARISANEGRTEVFRGSSTLRVQQARLDGMWTGSWAAEDIPVIMNPKFYPTQKLTIEFDIRVNGDRKTLIFKDFVPRHITRTETVNLLTM